MVNLQREEALFFHTYNRFPISISYGEGCFLFTQQGEKYLDFISGIGVNALGYGNTMLIEAITEQAKKYIHASNLFLQTPQFDLAEKLLSITNFSKVFFCNSGTESIEASIKLCRKWGLAQYPNKTKLFSLTNSFHGRTYGALSLTDKSKYKENFGDFLSNMDVIVFNDSSDLESKIDKKTAAVFLVFVQGEGGVFPISNELCKKLYELREKFDFLIVADEVQSGCGRTGAFFSYMHYMQHNNATPDLVCAAKPLGGGLPLASVIGNEKVGHLFTKGSHGTTFGGNPVATAAGLSLIEQIFNKNLMKNATDAGLAIKQGLISLQQNFPEILDIRQQGDTCAFVGPSGSGKTTLLGLCAGLDSVTSGHVFFDGADITTFSQNELAKFRNTYVGFVFQNFQLISSLTALENVMAPLELRGGKPPLDEAKQLLDKVGLSHRIHHFPSEMSGGEQQRVAIARSFINKPKIIFADEPTGNLDFETGQRIENVLFELNTEHKTSLILVTHNLDLAHKTHRILKLKAGSLVRNVYSQKDTIFVGVDSVALQKKVERVLDTAKVSSVSKWKVIGELKFSVKSILRYHMSANNQELTPSYFLTARENAFETELYRGGSLYNSPLIHGVYAGDIKLSFSLLNLVKLELGGLFEHRGFSYGITNVGMIFFIPKIKVTIDTSFTIAGEKFKSALNVGYLENVKVNQRLFIYNMDSHGGTYSLIWRSLRLGLTVHADYLQWIGLNLGDMVSISLGLNNVRLDRYLYLDADVLAYGFLNSLERYSFQKYFLIPNVASVALSGLYGGVSVALHSKEWKIYAEYTYRYSNTNISFVGLSAIVAGGEVHYEDERFSISAMLEGRFYGWGSLAGFKNETKSFLNTAAGSEPFYGGAQIVYPISWYERPFSQLAVFTEYQGQDVYGLSLVWSLKYCCYDLLYLTATADMNLLGASLLPVFVYPLYAFSAGWEPFKDVQFEIFASNREMNLYRHYPALSAMKFPRFGIALKINFEHLIK
ncbi:hypothetical protein CHS0354_023926 [Potamilus streckersoni]|uniref:ABC transporter domain-containing protein n=1 Tax=Potamilus streckersoni TaxID=2493646 RepID=A0AAE0RZ36_9BIVA|nr:hypothetical protein CHS0354_023926 [Potamilus streckersoni]